MHVACSVSRNDLRLTNTSGGLTFDFRCRWAHYLLNMIRNNRDPLIKREEQVK